jgi:hypothetical protein
MSLSFAQLNIKIQNNEPLYRSKECQEQYDLKREVSSDAAITKSLIPEYTLRHKGCLYHIEPNRFPYDLDSTIQHMVLWNIDGDDNNHEDKPSSKFVQSWYRSKFPNTFVIAHVNPKEYQSIPSIWHMHVFVYSNQPRPKTLVISVPFEGHINVLGLGITPPYIQNAHFLVLGWPNVRLSNTSRDRLRFPVTELITSYNLEETDPMKWTERRQTELLPRVMEFIRDHGPFTTIVYDTFCTEGFFASKIMGIPSICSISSQSFHEKSVQTSILGVDVYKVSDGPWILADVNIQWSQPVSEWHAQKLTESGMNPVAYPKQNILSRIAIRDTVYISMGTIIMGHLWKHNESVREFVKMLIVTVCNLCTIHYPGVRIVVTTMGNKEVETYGKEHIENKNIQYVNYADQPRELKRALVFVFHGGNNSFQEAVQARVSYMVAVPFFGDQHETSEIIDKSNMGVHVKLKCKDKILTSSRKERDLQHMVFCLRKHMKRVRYRHREYNPYSYVNENSAPDVSYFINMGKIQFQNGDLLFGCNEDRQHYVDLTKSDNEIKLNRFCHYSELCDSENRSLPRVLDIYHDSIISKNRSHVHTLFDETLEEYSNYLQDKGLGIDTSWCNMFTQSSWEDICKAGIDFFIQRGVTIHFIIGPHYQSHVHRVTREELYHTWDPIGLCRRKNVKLYHFNEALGMYII